MAEAKRDQNYVPTLTAVSSVDGVTPVVLYADPTTHRLYVDLSSGAGTVTSVSVATANGFAGTVATATTTPAITISTGVTGFLLGNGTGVAAAVSGTDIKTINGTSLLGAGDIVISPGITIGDTITSGLPDAMLFVDAAGDLGNSDDVSWDDTNKTLYINFDTAYAPDDRDHITIGVVGSADFYNAYGTAFYGNAAVTVSTSRGTAITAESNTLNYDMLGEFGFYAYQDASGEPDDYADMAAIQAQAVGVTAGNLGADLLFLTKKDGGFISVGAILDSNGKWGVNAGAAARSWTKPAGTTPTVNLVDHGYVAGDRIIFTVSGGTLPSPIVNGTTYYVIATGLVADAFQFSATLGGAAVSMTTDPAGTYYVRVGTSLVATDTVHTISASTIGTIVRGYASQTANLSEWQDSTGAILTAVNKDGRIGIRKSTDPTATLHLGAGSATASTAPLKFTAGTNLTTPEAGAMEFTNAEDGLTFTAVATRRKVVLDTATQALTNKTINNVTITAPATSAVLTIANGKTLTANASLTLAGTDAKTLTVSNSLTLAGTDATVMTFPSTTQTVAGLTATQTFTNKRITKREVTTASTATLTIDSDSTDIATVTAQAAGLTIAAPTGTPTQGQPLIIRIKDNGTARALTWNATWKVMGVTLPTTTVISKLIYVGAIYNSTSAQWDVLAVNQEA